MFVVRFHLVSKISTYKVKTSNITVRILEKQLKKHTTVRAQRAAADESDQSDQDGGWGDNADSN